MVSVGKNSHTSGFRRIVSVNVNERNTEFFLDNKSGVELKNLHF